MGAENKIMLLWLPFNPVSTTDAGDPYLPTPPTYFIAISYTKQYLQLPIYEYY